MEHSSDIPRINRKPVSGKGHIQPGVNRWIGVFTAGRDLLKGDPKRWKAATVKYEGPFYCRGKYTSGRGEAKIIHVRCPDKDKVIINIEGTGEPQLDDKEKMPATRSLTEAH